MRSARRPKARTPVLGAGDVKGEDDPVIARRARSWSPTTSRTSARRSATCCASITAERDDRRQRRARRSRCSSSTISTWCSATSRCPTRPATTSSPPPASSQPDRPGHPDDRLRLRPQPLASSAPARKGLQAVLFKPFKVDQLLTEVRKAPSGARRTIAGRSAPPRAPSHASHAANPHRCHHLRMPANIDEASIGRIAAHDGSRSKLARIGRRK